jgi:hypothetical protein
VLRHIPLLYPLSYPSLYFYQGLFLSPSPFQQLHYTMPDASKPIQKGAPSHLLSYPSVSKSLSTLPQAKNLAHVSVYTSSMSGQHAAESEAKVCSGHVPLTTWTMLTSPTLLASKCITEKCWVSAIARLRELRKSLLSFSASTSRPEIRMQQTSTPTQNQHSQQLTMKKPVCLSSRNGCQSIRSCSLGSTKTTRLMVTHTS